MEKRLSSTSEKALLTLSFSNGQKVLARRFCLTAYKVGSINLNIAIKIWW